MNRRPWPDSRPRRRSRSNTNTLTYGCPRVVCVCVCVCVCAVQSCVHVNLFQTGNTALHLYCNNGDRVSIRVLEAWGRRDPGGFGLANKVRVVRFATMGFVCELLVAGGFSDFGILAVCAGRQDRSRAAAAVQPADPPGVPCGHRHCALGSSAGAVPPSRSVRGVPVQQGVD